MSWKRLSALRNKKKSKEKVDKEIAVYDENLFCHLLSLEFFLEQDENLIKIFFRLHNFNFKFIRIVCRVPYQCELQNFVAMVSSSVNIYNKVDVCKFMRVNEQFLRGWKRVKG